MRSTRPPTYEAEQVELLRVVLSRTSEGKAQVSASWPSRIAWEEAGMNNTHASSPSMVINLKVDDRTPRFYHIGWTRTPDASRGTVWLCRTLRPSARRHVLSAAWLIAAETTPNLDPARGFWTGPAGASSIPA